MYEYINHLCVQLFLWTGNIKPAIFYLISNKLPVTHVNQILCSNFEKKTTGLFLTVPMLLKHATPRTYEICLWNCSSALESVTTEIKRYKSGIGNGINYKFQVAILLRCMYFAPFPVFQFYVF